MRRQSLIPSSALGTLDRGLGRLFDGFFDGFGLIPAAGPGVAIPPLDLVETPEAYRLEVDLPGFGEDDIQVSLEEGVLELRAEKRVEEHSEDERSCYAERRHGSFARRLRLPGEVDSERVEATLANGVLTVLLPKQERTEPQRIAVRRAD